MAPTIIETIGAANANSFESLAEANTYFDNRLALPVAWVSSGDNSKRALIMATRVLSAMNAAVRTYRMDANGYKYIYVSKAWTGQPATAGQALAWPRLGMFDANGNPLDVSIVSISATNPAVVTVDRPHGLAAGESVLLHDTNCTPSLDGAQTATVLTSTTFSVAVTVTGEGTTGRMFRMPQALKDAESELAGQLIMADTTLDNAVLVGGITSVRAGSVAVSFKSDIQAHVLPDAVMNLMPASWFTDEQVLPVMAAEFELLR